MKIKIGMQENYKKYFSIDEVNAIAEMKKDNFSEINENGIELSDFTSYPEKHILKLSVEFCKHNGAIFFSDERLSDIDILVHVIFYDGYNFSDEMYYYSDFILREDGDFENYKRTAIVK